MNIVITHLIGGLGNQMFQYAAGYALSRRLNASLKCDISEFAEHKAHNGLEISKIFNCAIKRPSPTELDNVLGRNARKGILKRIKIITLSYLYNQHVLIDRYKPEDGIKLKAPSYIKGYWQSEKYFNDYSHEIRRIFDFRSAMDGRNQEISNHISSSDSISLHVRRGDYITNRKAKRELGTVPMSYFKSAIAYITKKVASPRFFVFSDDQRWVKSNLHTGFPTDYIENNKGPCSFFDMQLMSQCRHHIITNSSFSWWGAWLNPDQEKIVIGPRRWFANPKRLYNPCPPEWVLM